MVRESDCYIRSPKRAIGYYWIQSTLTFITEILSTLFIYYLWLKFNWYHFVIYLIILLALICFTRWVIEPYLKYYFHFYKLENNNIEIKKNFIFKIHKISKIERIQYIELKSNPIMKKMKLKEVQFVTAGHNIVLPYVSEDKALKIRNLSLEKLRGVDTDV